MKGSSALPWAAEMEPLCDVPFSIITRKPFLGGIPLLSRGSQRLLSPTDAHTQTYIYIYIYMVLWTNCHRFKLLILRMHFICFRFCLLCSKREFSTLRKEAQ